MHLIEVKTPAGEMELINLDKILHIMPFDNSDDKVSVYLESNYSHVVVIQATIEDFKNLMDILNNNPDTGKLITSFSQIQKRKK